MSNFIDRRPNGKGKSSINRQRFLERYKGHIREAVAKSIQKGTIKSTGKNDIDVSIPDKDISEPNFSIGKGGVIDYVTPGNRSFQKGDKLTKPKSGGGEGSSASLGEGEDDFTFQLTKEEFMEIFFEDLALPNLVKENLADLEKFKYQRAGFVKDSNPSNLNIIRSLKQSYSRKISTSAGLLEELEELDKRLSEEISQEEVQEIHKRIEEIRARLKNIPFLDTTDLRYNNQIKVPKPTSQAVMFCLMDVSGSMGEKEKDIAKRFYILLYLFLNKCYEKVDIVFLSHHVSAKEVTEDEFFYSRESGGTVVSSVLELMNKIIEERYDLQDWNIYAAQVSDGDNWGKDSVYCKDILVTSLMPKIQYYAYIEIAELNQNLWDEYEKVSEIFENFQMQRVVDRSQVYPVFRNLFKKKDVNV